MGDNRLSVFINGSFLIPLLLASHQWCSVIVYLDVCLHIQHTVISYQHLLHTVLGAKIYSKQNSSKNPCPNVAYVLLGAKVGGEEMDNINRIGESIIHQSTACEVN